jgi:hypothetical protein
VTENLYEPLISITCGAARSIGQTPDPIAGALAACRRTDNVRSVIAIREQAIAAARS